MKKKNEIDLFTWVGVIIITILTIITQSTLLLVIGIILLTVGLILYKLFRTLFISKIKDIDKRIEENNKLMLKEKNEFQKAFYINNISSCYFEKGEYEKALQLIQEAKQIILADNDKTRITIGVPILEICKINEVTYLIELQRFEEASRVLLEIDDEQIKNKTYIACLYLARANLAINRGFSTIARNHLGQINDLNSINSTNIKPISNGIFLAQIKCDMLENDMTSAISKLDKIISDTASTPALIKKALELKQHAESAK